MPRVERTGRAEADLLEIWLYIAADDERAATRLIEQFDEAFGSLARFPRLGPSRPELMKGLRSYPVSSYLVFYTELEGGDGVRILRVLHGARDAGATFAG